MKMKFPYEEKSIKKVLKLVKPTALKWCLSPSHMTLETVDKEPKAAEFKIFKKIEKLVSKFRYR